MTTKDSKVLIEKWRMTGHDIPFLGNFFVRVKKQNGKYYAYMISRTEMYLGACNENGEPLDNVDE